MELYQYQQEQGVRREALVSITLDSVTFRWDGQELPVTMATSQKRLTGSSAVKLLDFLLALQRYLYIAEQARELPTWAHPPLRLANRQTSEEQLLRLTSGTIITSKPDEQE